MAAPLVAAAARGAASTVAKRGVQNAARSRRNVTARSGSLRRAQNPNAHRQTVPDSTSRFIQRKSLAARSDQFNPANDNDVATDRETEVITSSSARHPQQSPAQERTQGAQNAALNIALRRMNFVVIGAALNISLFVFFFGVIGLAIIGLGHTSILFGITVDDVVGFLGSAISFLTGSNAEIISASSFGLLIAMSGSFIAFCSYLAIGLWYQMTGRQYLNTPLGMLVTFFCAAADMVLITQLFPWLFIWVLLVESGYLSSDDS